MKKLAILICGFVVIALSSCGSSTTQCTCVAHYSGTGSEGISDKTTTQEFDGKCSDNNSTTTVMDLTLTVTCN
jgi:hypothetical protein